ncbi:MAG: hypothetical protein PHF00_08280, partial [Elusimicrobia bacterium]|nr:hypothetical protein [Elusimicrobiota bacterium]
KAAEEGSRAAEGSVLALQKEQKDLKKIGELLRADNERLERSIKDCRAGYARAAAKLREALAELKPPEASRSDKAEPAKTEPAQAEPPAGAAP